MRKDFEAFQSEPPMPPPLALSRGILERVRADLSPSIGRVLLKAMLVHAGTAMFTLSVCPQLGFRLVGEGHGLMGLFMLGGEAFCTIACGFFFLGASLLAIAWILRPEEVRVLRKNRAGGIGSLALFSSGVLLAMNPEALGEAPLWMAGALLGALLSLEGGWRARGLAPRRR